MSELHTVQHIAHRAGRESLSDFLHAGDQRIMTILAFDLADTFTVSHCRPTTRSIGHHFRSSRPGPSFDHPFPGISVPVGARRKCQGRDTAHHPPSCSTSCRAWFPGELPTDRLGVVAELRTGGTDTPGTPAELGHHIGHRHGPGVPRRGFPYDHVACGVLLVVCDVLGRVDPTPGNLMLVEHFLEFFGGQRTHPPLDDPVQLLGVVTACLVCGKTFVHLQLLLPHRLAETAVETVAVGCDEHLTPVRAGVDVRRCHTGKGASGTSTSDPTEFPIGDERLTERENTLVQSHVDLLTTSAVLAFPQSSKCAVDREKTRDLVTETDPGAYRGSIRIPGKCTQTTHGLGDTAKT